MPLREIFLRAWFFSPVESRTVGRIFINFMTDNDTCLQAYGMFDECMVTNDYFLILTHSGGDKVVAI